MVLLLQLAASGTLSTLSAEHTLCLFIVAGVASRYHGLSPGSVEFIDAAVVTADV